MKKLERLAWVEEHFGERFVSPYFACYSYSEMEAAICKFEIKGKTYGIRTDTRGGHEQGFLLPFIWRGSREEAMKLWLAHGEKFVYIVCENVPRVRLNAVAYRIDSEHVLFEFNDREPAQHQRNMYQIPENVRRLAVGPNRFVIPWGEGALVRSVDPSDVAHYGFDRIYDILIHSDEDEATFSVREDDGRVIVW